MTAIAQVAANDLLAAFAEIKATGSIHGVTYSQTVAVTHDEIFLFEDLSGTWIAHAPDKFPAVLARYEGKESVERDGHSVRAELLFRIVGILADANHSEMTAFEEDIEYAIEQLRDGRATTGYHLFNHRYVSSSVTEARLTRYDASRIPELNADQIKAHRIIDAVALVTAHYDPLQLRN